MQIFSIVGQGVPEIRGGTDRQTQDEDLLYRLSGVKKENCDFSSHWFYIDSDVRLWFENMRDDHQIHMFVLFRKWAISHHISVQKLDV